MGKKSETGLLHRVRIYIYIGMFVCKHTKPTSPTPHTNQPKSHTNHPHLTLSTGMVELLLGERVVEDHCTTTLTHLLFFDKACFTYI